MRTAPRVGSGLVGVALLRVGKGLLGLLVLAALFVNVALWMLPAANGNATNRVGLIDLLVPGSLTTFSLAGFVRRWPPSSGGESPRPGAAPPARPACLPWCSSSPVSASSG